MKAILACTSIVALSLVSLSHGQPGEPIAQPGTQPERPPVIIRGVEYMKLETRDATRARMLDLLAPARVKWGSFSIVGPFDFKKQGELKVPHGPEVDLARFALDGAGPDMAATYIGKDGKPVRWLDVGQKMDEKIDFSELLPGAPNGGFTWASAYAAVSAVVDKPTAVDIRTGSDDGMRMWVNGKLMIDADEMRGLDPDNHKVRLDLKPGVNHVLFKISQGQGGFEMQLSSPPVIDDLTRQMLEYHLDVDFPTTPEAKYYASTPMIMPPDVVMEVGGLAMMPDGRPIACTRRGDVYILDNAYESPAVNVKYTKFASGLHEPLGLAVRVEREAGKDVVAVYCVQRGEMTRMVDLTGDDVADLYQTFSDGWGVSGNYHEFAFGPKFDEQGNAWVTLNVGFCDALGKSIVPYRGWALRIDKNGTITPICGGLRSPNGIGFGPDGQAFYLDNQGDWVGTNRLSPLVEGGFSGHPSGLRWRSDYTPEMEPIGTRPPVLPATVWFPYKKMGQSTADFVLASPREGAVPGAFGPFDGHVFVGDQTLCTVMRVTIEKVDGVHQGACYPFRRGLQCGVNRLAFGKDGSLFVGQTDRGWGSIGRARYGIERIHWTGLVPFEIKEVKIQPDGFLVEFTRPFDPASAGNAESWRCINYTYSYHAKYGSDEIGTMTNTIRAAEVLSPTSVRLRVDGMRSGGMGYVHEITIPGVRSADREEPLHNAAYYTVQRIPSGG